mgnify:CR=1 FL=1
MSDSLSGDSLHQVLITRRTIHSYKPEAVPEDAVWRALEAAHHAPNHKLTWPWRFTWAGPETRRQLTNLVVAVKARAAPLTEDQRKKVEAKVQTPAHLVVVSVQREADSFRAREDYAAASCAIQNFMLSLHGHGIGSKWGTGRVTREEATYELLGISPDDEEIIGFVWVGVPSMVPEIQRPTLSEHVRRLP